MKPVDPDEPEEPLGQSSGEERSVRFEVKKKSNRDESRESPSPENVGLKSHKGERKGRGTGVLSALIDSIREVESVSFEDSGSLVSSEEGNEQPKRGKSRKQSKKRKKKDAESVDISDLLTSLESQALKQSSETKGLKRDMSSTFDAVSIPSSSDESTPDSRPDFGCETQESLSGVTSNQEQEDDEEILSLTELEVALRRCVREDYSSSLKLNEWLPSQCIDARSEVARQMNEDVKAEDISERHEFFYSQWMEQIGYLSSLTKGFTRKIHDCFVNKDQISAISNIKESNPELLLDPEDKILISVRNSEGCVILNRLVNIANSQEKLISEMNKETGGSKAEESDSSLRLKYGVISLKARTKLWWYCRMAEHCKLVGREGGNVIKYYVVENVRGGRRNSSSLIFSENADIISSTDPTMQLFEKDGSEVKKGETEHGGDEYEESGDEIAKMSELDSKWLELSSSVKVSNRARPWEKRRNEAEPKAPETKSPDVEEDTTSRSKELFKFMLKNIGPRPIWTSTNIIGNKDELGEPPIEIEPPRNLSSREQGQLKIKWLQMKSQAEKLATHQFKIMDPETRDLDYDSLKHWCELFKVNLLFPRRETHKTRRIDKYNILDTNQSMESEHLPAVVTEAVSETLISQDKELGESLTDAFETVTTTKRNSLPLDLEYVSDVSGSEVEVIQEEGDVSDAEAVDLNLSKTDNDSENIDDDYSVEDLTGHELGKDGSEEEDREDETNLGMRKEAYRKLKAIRRNRRRFKKRMMEKYGHLFENEAKESDEDGANILGRGVHGNDDDEDDDDDIDWDELSGFSDFIDDNNYEDGELDGDAIQAHLRHMKQIEEKQYRQLFTLEGIKERKNKIYGFAADQDDGIEGETRLEKKKNEMLFNSAFFDDDVISELWTDEEEQDDYDEEIDERNLTDMLGVDYEEWQNSLPKKANSSDESLNEQRKLKYNILKDSLIKESSANINIIKQRLHSIKTKLTGDNLSQEEKKGLEAKYLESMEKLKKLLNSIHFACNKCIYENPQFFDHIDIYLYIQKRQEARQEKKPKDRDKNRPKQKGSFLRENSNSLNESHMTVSDSEDEIVSQKKVLKSKKNVVNVKGGRFIISR